MPTREIADFGRLPEVARTGLDQRQAPLGKKSRGIGAESAVEERIGIGTLRCAAEVLPWVARRIVRIPLTRLRLRLATDEGNE
jgi:hypothetical protein